MNNNLLFGINHRLPIVSLNGPTGCNHCGRFDSGAIQVSPAMETNVTDIYAAGDCVEARHRLLMRSTYLPLGTTAHKQERAAGENTAGGQAEFQGSLGTQVVKIFDLVVARTGLRNQKAVREGFDPLSIDSESWDHKLYYPGAPKVRIRITGDRKTHRLLGAQMVGRYGAEISKRIDLFAVALFNGMKCRRVEPPGLEL